MSSWDWNDLVDNKSRYFWQTYVPVNFCESKFCFCLILRCLSFSFRATESGTYETSWLQVGNTVVCSIRHISSSFGPYSHSPTWESSQQTNTNTHTLNLTITLLHLEESSSPAQYQRSFEKPHIYVHQTVVATVLVAHLWLCVISSWHKRHSCTLGGGGASQARFN